MVIGRLGGVRGCDAMIGEAIVVMKPEIVHQLMSGPPAERTPELVDQRAAVFRIRKGDAEIGGEDARGVIPVHVEIIDLWRGLAQTFPVTARIGSHFTLTHRAGSRLLISESDVKAGVGPVDFRADPRLELVPLSVGEMIHVSPVRQGIEAFTEVIPIHVDRFRRQFLCKAAQEEKKYGRGAEYEEIHWRRGAMC